MKWVWTWGGKCFGYFDGDDLYTFSGKHVGRRSGGAEIYSPRGEYLGEAIDEERLITNHAKRNWRGPMFAPYGRRGSFSKYANYAGYAMYAGHGDFPGPETF